MTAIPAIWTSLHYRDAAAARTFLTSAFGFTERVAHLEGDVPVHVELTWDGPEGTVPGGVMFGPADGSDKHVGTGLAHVVLDDPDGLFDRAVAAGATVLSPPADTDYGSRMCVLADPEGNVWSFGTWYE